MHSLGFGNNRLATGFHKTRSILAEQVADAPATQPAPQSVASSPGNSADDAIEISDDDSSSESGGMILNVGDATILQSQDSIHPDDDDDDDDDEMEDVETKDDEGLGAHKSEAKGILASESTLIQSASQNGSLQSDISDNIKRPSTSQPDGRLRLADLSQPELELQFRYIFFYLNREEVDLDRSAVCLGCLQEGHMQTSCPEKACSHCGSVDIHPTRLCPVAIRCTKCRERGHASDNCITGIKVTTVPCDLCGTLEHTEVSCPERFFPSSFRTTSSPVRIWVSCCHCASKSHYVGDCPELDQNFAPRWSMKALDYPQIINLSLESNMRRLEREAANRGLRPDGLLIKGRAGMHHAGSFPTSATEDDSSENDFIRPRIETGARTHTARHNFSFQAPERFPPRSSIPRETSYDRYNPPSHRDPRPRNDWYSTDSFGRRKSRSASPGPPQPRRNEFDDVGSLRRRSRSPREFDRLRARSPRVRAPSVNSMSLHRGETDPPTQQLLADRPKDGISINLPVRKGSINSNAPQDQTNVTQERGKDRGIDGGQQSRQDNGTSIGARLVKLTKKSKQTKAAASSSQADNEPDSDLAETVHRLDGFANIDADVVFPHRRPPDAILKKFVEAMNVHRDNIGYRHLALSYRRKMNPRLPRVPFFIDRSRPSGQRELEIDTRRATFIWHWSKTSLPEILKETRLLKNAKGSAAAASTQLAHTPISTTELSENDAFLELFGPMLGENLENVTKTMPNGIEHDEESDPNLHDSRNTKPSNPPKVNAPLRSARRGKWTSDNLRRRATRAGGRVPEVREFAAHLDLFNAPRFDMGIAPVFLRYEDGRFSYIDSAITDFNERSIPVSGTHIEELWAFFAADSKTQKKIRLEVRSRLHQFSHPEDRSLTRQAAEAMLKDIMPPGNSTNKAPRPATPVVGIPRRKGGQIPGRVGKATMATRSQQAELTEIDYEALARAEKELGRPMDTDSESEDWED